MHSLDAIAADELERDKDELDSDSDEMDAAADSPIVTATTMAFSNHNLARIVVVGLTVSLLNHGKCRMYEKYSSSSKSSRGKKFSSQPMPIDFCASSKLSLSAATSQTRSAGRFFNTGLGIRQRTPPSGVQSGAMMGLAAGLHFRRYVSKLPFKTASVSFTKHLEERSM